MPASAIGRHLGASSRTVRFRIDRLVSSGLVVIGAWVDTDKAGLPITATATINAVPHLARGIAERLATLEEVVYVSMNEPAGTIVISVVAATGPDAREIAENAVGSTPGVLDLHVFVETTFLKDLASWYPPPRATRESRPS